MESEWPCTQCKKVDATTGEHEPCPRCKTRDRLDAGRVEYATDLYTVVCDRCDDDDVTIEGPACSTKTGAWSAWGMAMRVTE